MNAFSVVIAVFLGLLLATSAVLLFLTIVFNVKAGAKYRESLVLKLQSLRLHKMLDALGINTYEYLHKVNVTDIHKHMNRCSACDNTEECDDQLSNKQVTEDAISFCKNEQSLKELLSTRSIT